MLNQAAQFLKEAVAELRQSTWLSRQQAVDSTKVVALLVVLMALYVSGVDFALSTLVRTVLGR